MLNLMRLELMKFKLWPVIRGAFLATFIISILISLIMFDGEVNSYDSAFQLIDRFPRAAFMIFGASLIAKFIIQEFQNKTMTVMFMYPINRKKMMAAKMLIVILFTLCAIIISEIIIFSFVYVVNIYYPVITEPLMISILAENAVKLFVNALATTGISLIPLYFGMKKYSVRTTFVSAIIIVCLVTASLNGEISVFDFIVIPITLACVGLLIAYMAIRKIEQVDLFQ
ncbi:ABC transporter permease [Bacillus pseudomycoides]|uniref:ABC transporter permease n=1 Tax=Bacillus pseudomycoides TaxID=64104 RepID=A0A1Y3MGK3_9BACI|nr:ABC transporter permease [Bacillus pseudomycoides]OUM49559.1 ABC transporter permease [Bacillus pseudomycoides]